MIQSSLACYLKEIGKYPLLNAAQEQELGRRIKEGDLAAKEKLINCNLRLVVSVAKNYQSNNAKLEDLIMAGNTGLVTAAEKFDADRGFRFSTCAVPWIKQAIMKSIIDNSRTIRIPPHIIQLFSKEKKAIASLYEQGVEHPTVEQICKLMGITEEKYADMQGWKKNTVSLDTPIGDEEDGDTVADLCADNNVETPEQYAKKMTMQEVIGAAVNELDPRTREIMKLRFGLDGYKEHTLEEIGDLIQPTITRERVRQIINQQIAVWRTSGKFNNLI